MHSPPFNLVPKSLPNSPAFFILTAMNLRPLILFAALPLLALLALYGLRRKRNY